MAVPYHTHEFLVPTATLAEAEARSRSDVLVSPASLPPAATLAQGLKADTAIQPETLPSVPFTPAGGTETTVQTALNKADKAAQLNSLTNYYASADAGNNNAAVLAAAASGKSVHVPDGQFSTTLDTGSLPKKLHGEGQVSDAGGKRGRFFTHRKTPVTEFGAPESIITAFNGDLSTVQFPIEHRITGANTLGGGPGSGYVQHNETSAIFIQAYNDSGYAQGADRTGASVLTIACAQYGYGDFGGIKLGGIVVPPSDVTTWGNTSALTGLIGDWVIGGNIGYLNPLEWNFFDYGKDGAAIPLVFNFYRENDTAAKGESWIVLRPQSKGSKYIDGVVVPHGKFKSVVDATDSDLAADKGAIKVRRQQRIYLDAKRANRSSGINFCEDPGNVWIEFEDGLIKFFNGGELCFSIGDKNPIWNYPALLNGWTPKVDTGRATPSYRINPGFVTLRGLASGGAGGGNMAVLPAGYRPQTDLQYATSTPYGPSSIVVTSTGIISIVALATDGSTGTNYVSWDGINIPI